jgi:carboxynorspermidine decarboxylase
VSEIDPTAVEAPAFVIDIDKLEENCALLARVQRESGAKVLLALKGFAAWSTFDVIKRYLSGTTASGPFEARLGREHFGGEVHVYAPAFSNQDVEDCLHVCDHMVFNSYAQWERYRARCQSARQGIRFGLRVNPEHSEVKVPLYDPCRPGSRLGTRRSDLEGKDLSGITGLHFHTLCELGSDALERTLEVFEARFGDLLPRMEWVNFGGGHHITRPGYDIDRLVRLVRNFSEKYGVAVYLEPGEAIALHAGVLVASVLDVIDNDGAIAMLDVSATAHMPDVLEMPYRPVIDGAGEPGEFPYDYRLGGVTCLAGDEIGVYSFPKPLSVGDRLVFRDMAIYTMVKTTMFNGVRHPSIVLSRGATGAPEVVRRFGYEDYRDRLS